MEPSQLLNRVSGMVRRTLSRVSVETLIANRVAKVFAEAPQDVKERAPADIKARLANAPQQTRDLVAVYRKKAFAAMVKNEPLPADADPSALDELVRASELTLNETEETRRARFVEIGKMANFEFSMEYSKNAEENAELNGMLMTLLVKHGTVPLFKAGLLMSAVRSFPAEPKTDDERQQIIAPTRPMPPDATTTAARLTQPHAKCGAACAKSWWTSRR